MCASVYNKVNSHTHTKKEVRVFEVHGRFVFVILVCNNHVNDPSAGSPTETLLRLLLPLNGKV